MLLGLQEEIIGVGEKRKQKNKLKHRGKISELCERKLKLEQKEVVM